MTADGTPEASKALMKQRIIQCVFAGLVFILISGCTSTPRLEPGAQPGPPYLWGSYEEQVHAFLTMGNMNVQIMALEQDLFRITAGGRYPPPGLFAQLGLLYAETGSRELAIAFFREEKAFFPDASVFMNFLIARLGE